MWPTSLFASGARTYEAARSAASSEADDARAPPTGCSHPKKEDAMRGTGRAVFVAMLLVIVGTLNIIYGIGALDDANIFVNDKRFILDNLNTMGWVLTIIGIIHLTGRFP